MKERVKNLRKKLGLNQTQFGERIGVKQTTIAGYETGARIPLDTVIASICKEYNVNEKWLRTGSGGDSNMFIKKTAEDRFAVNLTKLSKTENKFIQNAINSFAESSPEKLQIIEEFFKECLGIDETEEKSEKEIEEPEQPILNAAHERTDINVTDKMKKHDDDLMDDDEFWK